MENLLKLAQWRNIAREKANVCCVWMVLSHLDKHRLRGGQLLQNTGLLTSLQHSYRQQRIQSLFLTARMGHKKCRSEENSGWRGWWEKSVFTKRRWREVTVVQLPATDKQGEMTASGYSSPGPKKKKKNHPFSLNIKAHITLKCIWHTCQPLLIFVPCSLIYCLVLNLCVSIIVNYLSNSSFEHFW